MIDKRCEQVQSTIDKLLVQYPELEKKVRRALLCDAPEARGVIVEALKFMSLAASSSGRPLTPSHRVDLAWHELILFTAAYQNLCDQQFGKFIHHHPGGNRLDHQKQFADTLTAYRETFGEPPVRFWGNRDESIAGCGNCESD